MQQPKTTLTADVVFFVILKIMKTILLIATIAMLFIGYYSQPIPENKPTFNLFNGTTKQLATVTGYSAIETCANTNCIMSNGKRAGVGFIACPREIKLGTKVQINGITYECGDRTALKYNGRFDIFFGYKQEDYHEAIKFGKQQLWITVLKN